MNLFIMVVYRTLQIRIIKSGDSAWYSEKKERKKKTEKMYPKLYSKDIQSA